MATEKEKFIHVWEREFQTTLKVLKAYPPDKLDLKPAEKSKSARDLLMVFANEQHFFSMGLDGNIDFMAPMPKAPSSLEAIVGVTEKGNEQLVAKLKSMAESDFGVTFPWMVAPKTMGKISKQEFSWLMLMDSIHHRGQLSVYIRLAGGKVPSIYGPTADEPWM